MNVRRKTDPQYPCWHFFASMYTGTNNIGGLEVSGQPRSKFFKRTVVAILP